MEKENEESTIRQEAIDELDSNLRDIIALESPFPNDTKKEKTISPKKKSPVRKNEPSGEGKKFVNTPKEERDKIVGPINSQISLISRA